MQKWFRSGARRLGALMYWAAGRTSQPEVQRAMMRFRRLPEKERRDKVALWWLLGEEGTPPFKMSMEDAGYSTKPHRAKCANCMSLYLHVEAWIDLEKERIVSERYVDDFTGMFPMGTWICDQMRGVVRPQDTCRLWSLRASSAEYRAYQRS